MSLANKSKSSGAGKFFRFISWTVLTLVSVAIIIPVGIFLYFDPNDYKEELSRFITEKSGLPLEIHGAIEMKYFPWLGLSVQNVTMAQPANFGTGDFIKIDSLDFKLPVRELLEKQFIVETLTLKGLKANLVQNKDGSSNWEAASEQVKQKNKPVNQVQTKESKSSLTDDNKPKKKLTFALKQFDITDGAITFTDKAQGETYSIDDLQLKGKQGDKTDNYPLEGKLNLKQIDNAHKQTLMEGKVKIDGHVTLAENISALFDTDIALTLPQGKAGIKNIDATLQVNFKPNKTILLDKMHVKAGDHQVEGKVTIPGDKLSPITFILKMNTLNLDKLKEKSTTTAQGESTKVAAKPQQSAPPPKASSKNSSRALNGEIAIDKLIHDKIEITHVKALIAKNNNTVRINPLTASLFQGTLTAQITKELNSAAPMLMKGDLNNIQIQPLLIALKDEKRLSGTASVNFNLAQNSDVNGVVKVGIKNGTLEGIDVKYYLSLAQSLVNKDKSPLEDSKQTKFGDLTATLNIHDNMVDNNDLAISAPDFKAKGEGSIWLGSKTIEYKMQAWRVHSDNQEHPNDYPLAIRIKGNLQHPKVEPDVDLYLKKGLEQEIKKQLGKQVEKNLGKILGGGSSTNPETGETTENNELQQKLEEKLNKGLNKLFKKKKE